MSKNLKNPQSDQAAQPGGRVDCEVRPLDYRLPELIEYLRQKVKECEDLNQDMDEANWGMETGVVISGNDAKLLIGLYAQASA